MADWINEYSRALTIFFGLVTLLTLFANYTMNLRIRLRDDARKIEHLSRILQVHKIDLNIDDSEHSESDVEEGLHANKVESHGAVKNDSTGHNKTLIVVAFISFLGVIFTSVFSYITESAASAALDERNVLVASMTIYQGLVFQAATWNVLTEVSHDTKDACSDEKFADVIIEMRDSLSKTIAGDDLKLIIRVANEKTARLAAQYGKSASLELRYFEQAVGDVLKSLKPGSNSYCSNPNNSLYERLRSTDRFPEAAVSFRNEIGAGL